MGDITQDPEVRKLGSTSGSGDGLIADFDLELHPTGYISTDPTQGIDTSLQTARVIVRNRPRFVQFLHEIYNGMLEAEREKSECGPCLLTIELTYGDETVRLQTELEKKG